MRNSRVAKVMEASKFILFADPDWPKIGLSRKWQKIALGNSFVINRLSCVVLLMRARGAE